MRGDPDVYNLGVGGTSASGSAAPSPATSAVPWVAATEAVPEAVSATILDTVPEAARYGPTGFDGIILTLVRSLSLFVPGATQMASGSDLERLPFFLFCRPGQSQGQQQWNQGKCEKVSSHRKFLFCFLCSSWKISQSSISAVAGHDISHATRIELDWVGRFRGGGLQAAVRRAERLDRLTSAWRPKPRKR